MMIALPMGAEAAGFALIEQSASGMGNAFAGGGAVAEDASDNISKLIISLTGTGSPVVDICQVVK